MSDKRQVPTPQPSKGGNDSGHIQHSANPPTIPIKIPMPQPKPPKK